jgi:hypothetical protein
MRKTPYNVAVILAAIAAVFLLPWWITLIAAGTVIAAYPFYLLIGDAVGVSREGFDELQQQSLRRCDAGVVEIAVAKRLSGG